MVISKKLSLQTRGNGDTHDITDAVARTVRESGFQSGTVTLFCPSSTSGLTTIEFEPGAVADLQRVFDEITPPGREYRHNERWGDGNGHSLGSIHDISSWQQVWYLVYASSSADFPRS